MRSAEAWARGRAWAVHLLTGSGIAFAFAAVAALCAPRPDPRWVFLWLMVPVGIDAIDGPLARRWQVLRWAPGIHGRTLDDIVDYFTFTFVPLLLVWRMDWLPWPGTAYVVLALVTSLFGFANRHAKQEEDGFFLGFPSYWNIYAFYAGLWVVRLGTLVPGLVCLLLSALTVLPIRFLYPNLAPPRWRAPLLWGAALWAALLLAMLPAYPTPAGWLVWISLVYPTGYVGLSLWLDLQVRRRTDSTNLAKQQLK